jgi:hypothetical protein
MKRVTRSIISIALTGIVTFSACTSKSTDNPVNNNTAPGAPTPSINDASGALAAVTSISYTTVAGITVPLAVNTAAGGFFTAPGSGSFIDGGTVTLNSKTLTKSSNNAYAYQNLTDPLTLGGSNAWTVAGASGVAAFSYTYNRPMPAYSDFNSLPATITRSAGVTVNLSGTVTDADSIYVVVTGTSNKYLLKRLAGNAASCEFSANELSALSASSYGLIQVCPWNYGSQTFDGKKYYFVNESAYTKSGITIN